MANTLNMNEIATLTSLQGKGFVRHADGTRSELVAGMKLGLGDIVITMPGSKATVQIADGRNFDLTRSQGDAIKIDQTVLDVLSDIHDVRVTDLSLVYPYVAHHIVTDPTVDPLSLNNDDLSNDLSQINAIDEADEPAAINDLAGGDLLSGNTYVVLHGNPLVTDTKPFTTEPGHFNDGFIPAHNPGFIPAASPLAYLIGGPAPAPAPAYVPIITLSMAATTLKDPLQNNLIDSSHATPVVDDEAGFVTYTVHTSHDEPQHFYVRVFDGSNDPVGHLLLDGNNQPVVVIPVHGHDDNYDNTFYVPVSEAQEGNTVRVQLEPFATDINFTHNELSSSFVVGELGSERDLPPASLHISITAEPFVYAESATAEGVAHYQIRLTDGNNNDVHLDQPLTVHWVLQNQVSPELSVEGDVTFQANQSTAQIDANVPEEGPGINNPTQQYTLGLLLDNNVNVSSSGQQLTINPVTVNPSDSQYSNLSHDLSSHLDKFLVATNTDLSFTDVEGSEAIVTAQFNTNIDPILYPDGIIPLEEDAPTIDSGNPNIIFSITSIELPALLADSGKTLIFDVNVYDESHNLIGTLAELDAHSLAKNPGSLNGNQLTFDVPVDLTQIHQPGTDLSANTYVSEDTLHGHSLTFALEAKPLTDAVALFINLDTSHASVTGSVIDDSAYEHASIQSITVDPLAIDNTDHGIAIFSRNQVQDINLAPVYDERVQFQANFDHQFGDATFNIVVHGPNRFQSIETINIGENPSSGSLTPTTNPSGDLVYESTAPDGTTLDYIVHTDGTSSLQFFAALPNTENNPQYTVSIEPVVGPGLGPFDSNGNVIEDVTGLNITTEPYTLVPDVHVTATIDGLNGSYLIDDEATVGVTISLDHQLAQETQYHVVIKSDDGSTVLYDGIKTVEAYSSNLQFGAGLLNDNFENKNLVINVTDVTSGAVYFAYGSNLNAVKINVVNDPTPISVQDIVNDPITITVTPPSTFIDDENPQQTTAVFSYQVQGEFLNPALTSPSNDPNFNWASVKFDVYSQALDANNNPIVGSMHALAVDPIILDLSNLSTSFSLNGTIDIPIALLGDGHQQILLEPQDPSISGFFPVTSAPFDVIDMTPTIQPDTSSGIDTYVLVDNSDGTSVVVHPGSGNHIESLDVLQPQGDTTTFQLDFGDHVVAGTSADFNSNHINQNPIAHLIFGSNGFVEFASQENGNPIPIDETNLQQAIDYLAQNCKQDGSTVEFNANINGVNSSYIFHQSADGYHLVNVSDTSSTVQGIDTQVFDQSKIHIVDHQ
jgi:hypothetical protein